MHEALTRPLPGLTASCSVRKGEGWLMGAMPNRLPLLRDESIAVRHINMGKRIIKEVPPECLIRARGSG